MKINGYPSNYYYQLLICLLIKFAVTDFSVKDKTLFDSLNKEARLEISFIENLNKILLKSWDPVKAYTLARFIKTKKSKFPSLFSITAAVIKRNNIALNAPIDKDSNEKLNAQEKRLDVLRYFIYNCNDPNSKKIVIHDFHYIYSSIYSHLNLLARSIDQDISTIKNLWDSHPEKIKPIHLACAFGNKEIVKGLLRLSKKVNVQDCYLRTPLHYACLFGNEQQVKLLLQKKADANIKDDNDRTALYYACRYNRIPAVKRILKMHPDLVNVRWYNQETPLHQAAKRGHGELCEMLIAYGASTIMFNISGDSPYSLVPKKDVLLKQKLETMSFQQDSVAFNAESQIRKMGNFRQVVSILLALLLTGLILFGCYELGVPTNWLITLAVASVFSCIALFIKKEVRDCQGAVELNKIETQSAIKAKVTKDNDLANEKKLLKSKTLLADDSYSTIHQSLLMKSAENFKQQQPANIELSEIVIIVPKNNNSAEIKRTKVNEETALTLKDDNVLTYSYKM